MAKQTSRHRDDRGTFATEAIAIASAHAQGVRWVTDFG